MTKLGHRRRRAWLAIAVTTGGLTLVNAGSTPAVPGPGAPPQSFTYLRSADGGEHFIPLQLADVSPEGEISHVVAGPTAVHALFDDVDPQPRRVFYRRSANGGRSFAASVRLDVPQFGAGVEVGDSGEADLATDGPGVHVAWEDDLVLEEDFVVPAPGIRLRDDIVLSNGKRIAAERPGGDPEDDSDNTILPAGFVIPAGSVDPRFDSAYFNGTGFSELDEVTNRDDVYYTRSTDEGRSFPAAVNVTNSPGAHNRDPDVDAEGGVVVIAYESEDVAAEENDVHVARSTDGGDTWATVNENLTNAPEAQDEPAVALDGRDVTVVFRNRVGNGDDGRIAFIHSADAGHTFSAMADLPRPGPTPSDFNSDTTPGILALDGVVHVLACHEDLDPLTGTDGFDLLYWRSTDGGASFADPTVIQRGSEPCNKPVLDGHGHNLHAVYEGDVYGESDVFLLESGDGGLTWGPARNLSSDAKGSSDPSVSVDPENPGEVHISWSDSSEFLFALRYGQRLPTEDGQMRRFANEDVIRFDGGAYDMVLDGSDLGLAAFRIDALAMLSPRKFVLSFTEPGLVPGVGWVDDSDLVLLTASSLGENTAGRFSPYFRGSAIGLTGDGGDIDALEIQQGDLYISTIRGFTVTDGVNQLEGKNEDIFRCHKPTTGPGSACESVSLAFDGSTIGLGEDLDAFAFDAVDPVPVDDEVPERQAFFSFRHDWSATTARGGKSDVASCLFPEADLTVPEPVFGLSDCGGPSVPLQTTFLARAHLLKENIMALELEF